MKSLRVGVTRSRYQYQGTRSRYQVQVPVLGYQVQVQVLFLLFIVQLVCNSIRLARSATVLQTPSALFELYHHGVLTFELYHHGVLTF